MMRIMFALLLFANLFNCFTQKKTDNFVFGADVLINKNGEKIVAQFMFYLPISEILNGKENHGFGKSPVIVEFPKLDGIAMTEKKSTDSIKIYIAEIDSFGKDHIVTFSRKDGEYQGILHLTENDLGKSVTVNFKKTKK